MGFAIDNSSPTTQTVMGLLDNTSLATQSHLNSFSTPAYSPPTACAFASSLLAPDRATRQASLTMLPEQYALPPTYYV